MSDSASERTPHERQLDALIAEYLQAADEGRPLIQAEFLRQHPEFAAELREFFADAGQIEKFALPPSPDPEETQPIPGSPSTPRARGTKVPYFGDYEILEELGVGGMGVVYKARQTKLNKIIALKMIKVGQLAGDDEVRRFQAEARAAAKLDHPGIVPVHEVGVDHGQHYYTMDYVGGGSLSKLHRDEPVAARRAAEIIKQMAEAMHYAHGQGIVHRDLKPANVLLTPSGIPRITDFGLAKRLWSDDDSADVAMTQTGQVMGTAGYMSPEQAAGKTRLVGPSADIYALGAVLYALLTSRAPFVGESQDDTIQQVIHKEPVSPRVLNPSIARDLETICLKSLEKEPHKRYGTAQLLADDLGRFIDGRPVIARPISRPARAWRWCRRNVLASSLAATTAMFLIVIATVAALGYTSTQRALKQANVRLYHLRIQRAYDSWKSGDLAKANELLADCSPALRNFEWHHLSRLCESPAIIDLATKVPETRLGIMAFSKNGPMVIDGERRLLLFSDEDPPKPTVWDFGQETTRLTLSGSGERIAAISRDGFLKLYDADTRTVLGKWPVDQRGAPVFSPDASLIAIVPNQPEQGITIVKSETGEVLNRLLPFTHGPGPTFEEHLVCWSPNSRYFAYADGPKVVIYDFEKRTSAVSIDLFAAATGGSVGGSPSLNVTCLCFTPNSQQIAVGLAISYYSSSPQFGPRLDLSHPAETQLAFDVVFLEVTKGKMVSKLKTGRASDIGISGAFDIKYKPNTDDYFIAHSGGLAAFRGPAELFRLANGVASLERIGIIRMLFNHNGTKMLTVENGKRMTPYFNARLRRVPQVTPVSYLTEINIDAANHEIGRGLQVGPSASRVVLKMSDKRLTVSDINDDRVIFTHNPAYTVSDFFSTDLAVTRIAMDGTHNKVVVLDVASKKAIFETNGNNGRLSPGGDILSVAGNGPESGSLWNVATGQQIPGFPGGGYLGPNGLLIQRIKQGLVVWDIPSGRKLLGLSYGVGDNFQFRLDRSGTRLAISHEGQGIKAGIEVWELKSARRTAYLPESLFIGGYANAFSPDGHRLAVAKGETQELAILNVVSSELEMALGSPGQPTWSPDGTRLAVVNGQGLDILDTADWTRIVTFDYPVEWLLWLDSGELLGLHQSLGPMLIRANVESQIVKKH